MSKILPDEEVDAKQYTVDLPMPPAPSAIVDVTAADDTDTDSKVEARKNGIVEIIEDRYKRDRVLQRRLTYNDLSVDQRVVYDAMRAWHANKSGTDTIRIGGYAGTGKSTLISVLAQDVKDTIAYCAYTGKASGVLRQRLSASGLSLGAYCGTIHGLIYRPFKDAKGNLRFGKVPLESFTPKLCVVDEASMVGASIWRDLNSFDARIIAVGDHGQLPPIGDAGISLLHEPDLCLEKIHRQAEGNPIIRLATHVRQGEPLNTFKLEDADPRVRFYRGSIDAFVVRICRRPGTFIDKAVLCYYNATRVDVNKAARRCLKRKDLLAKGDTIICLRNANVGDYRIYNGMRGVVEKVCKTDDLFIYADVVFPDDLIRIKNCRMLKLQFNRSNTFKEVVDIVSVTHRRFDTFDQAGLLFDYGYALTVHKAQGSQFNYVLLLAERGPIKYVTEEVQRRWLYTAITRAANTLECVI